MSYPILSNAFKQAVVGTYSDSATVIELASISDTVGNADYLPDGSTPFNVILYDTLFGNPADANNGGSYEIMQVTSVNYGDNEITVVRGQENSGAVTITDRPFAVLYGATAKWFTDLLTAVDGKIDTSAIVNDLTTGGASNVASAETVKVLNETKAPVQDTDAWVLTTSFTGSANPIASNLARFTHVEKIGDGMTQASGIFTFPRTGIWRVEFQGAYQATGELFFGGEIYVRTDASGTPVNTRRAFSFGQVKDTTGTSFCVLPALKVDSLADIKVYFRVQAQSSGLQTTGSSTALGTGMIFTRIGDLP